MALLHVLRGKLPPWVLPPEEPGELLAQLGVRGRHGGPESGPRLLAGLAQRLLCLGRRFLRSPGAESEGSVDCFEGTFAIRGVISVSKSKIALES